MGAVATFGSGLLFAGSISASEQAAAPVRVPAEQDWSLDADGEAETRLGTYAAAWTDMKLLYLDIRPRQGPPDALCGKIEDCRRLGIG